MNKVKCLFCEMWEVSGPVTYGVCRLNPPSIENETAPGDHFPITRSTDWCGKFREFFHPEVLNMKMIDMRFGNKLLNFGYCSQKIYDELLVHQECVEFMP